MKGDRIDFSPLDPSRDQDRWNDLLASVARRAVQARRRRLTVAVQLLTWSRPMLAAAAGLALVSWIGAMASGTGQAPTTTASEAPAMTLAAWAEQDRLPDTPKILELLGATHDTR